MSAKLKKMILHLQIWFLPQSQLNCMYV